MKNKILLLEDDISLIDGLRYSLKKNGFDVDIVRTVNEALSHLVELQKYDMLILDVTLPDGTGFEVCEKVRGYGNPILLQMRKSILFEVWIVVAMIILPNHLSWENYVLVFGLCCGEQDCLIQIRQQQ